MFAAVSYPMMPLHAERYCLAGVLSEQAVRCGRYEEAFQRVLNLEDISMVAWLCSQLDPGSILSQSPPVLSQLTLLSLIQQLGTDLLKVILTVCPFHSERACNTGKPRIWTLCPTSLCHVARMQFLALS